MKLTNDFTLEDFTRSDTATRKAISEQFKPSQIIIENVKELAVNVIQPLQDYLKKEIIITSGYRCNRLNRMIGGAVNSQHLQGEAADIIVKSLTTEQLIHSIKSSGLVFDQMIEEFGRWVHVSYNKGKNRNQIFRAVKKGSKTVYLPY